MAKRPSVVKSASTVSDHAVVYAHNNQYRLARESGGDQIREVANSPTYNNLMELKCAHFWEREANGWS